jgi:uncharacterized protein (TIGR03435 family)
MRSFLLAALSVYCTTVAAQAPHRSAFEVAAITPHKSLERGGSLRFLPGRRFQGTNVYTLALIAAAYGDGRPLLPVRIIGGPDWIRFERYDIAAKTTDSGSDVDVLYQRLPGLLRTLLEDRFSINTHWEQRRLRVLALTVARADRGPGPDLKPADCTPGQDALPADNAAAIHSEGAPPCHATVGPGSLDTNGLSLPTLSGVLSSQLNEIVVDRTNLRGLFQIKLQWNADTPALPTALREQLGLRLDSRTEPVAVLLIDHIARPTDN